MPFPHPPRRGPDHKERKLQPPRKACWAEVSPRPAGLTGLTLRVQGFLRGVEMRSHSQHSGDRPWGLPCLAESRPSDTTLLGTRAGTEAYRAPLWQWWGSRTDETQDHHGTPWSHGWGCFPNNMKQEFTPTLDRGLLGSTLHTQQRGTSLSNYQPSLPSLGLQEGLQLTTVHVAGMGHRSLGVATRARDTRAGVLAPSLPPAPCPWALVSLHPT